ncbi:MAG: hypothetical protein V4850_36335 [Myxococcota bacterium]
MALLLGWMLVGCGGQSGNEGSLTILCEEASRETAALDTLPEDFLATPREARAVALGTWLGTFEVPGAATPTSLSMEVTEGDAPIELVHTLRVRSSSDDTGPERFVSDSCPPRYEIPTLMHLVEAGGLLDEVLDVTLFVETYEPPYFHLDVPLEDIVGTAVPPWDAEEWETTELKLQVAWSSRDRVVGTGAWVSEREGIFRSRYTTEDFGSFRLER